MNRHLVVIDPQRDFCKPGGALFVPGADDDMKRLAKLVGQRRDLFHKIHVTLDSHQWIHIAHPIFWVGPNGETPEPFTVISAGEVANGTWTPRDRPLRDYALSYVRSLEDQGRYALTIWPPHCIIGTTGHAVHDELGNALHGWSAGALKPIDFVFKGSNLLTEHYSAIQADVPDPKDPSTQPNLAFVDRLRSADEIVVAGEALDYCLLNTVRDLVAVAPELAARLVILSDASSAIGECTLEGDPDFRSLAAKGMRTATTADYNP